MQFKNIPGQEKVINKLVKTVKENRVSHAQLFLGPQGSGKLALAVAYAQYISCKNKIDYSEGSAILGDSCGECPSCQKYEKLIHPDLHFVYPIAKSKKTSDKPLSKELLEDWREISFSRNYHFSLYEWYEKIEIENKQGIISANECDGIIKTLSLKPYESEYKVMIIWMVERLFHAAAPKILKVLEEPPNKTLFILISEDQDQLLATIRSRLQMTKIPKYTDKVIKDILINSLGAENNLASRISKIADGNLVIARKKLESLSEEDFNYTVFRKFLQTCYQNKFIELNSQVQQISGIGREKIKSFLSYGLQIARNSILNSYQLPEQIKAEGNEKNFMVNFSKILTPEKVPAFNEEIEKAIYHIERNGNAKIILTDLCLKVVGLISPYA